MSNTDAVAGMYNIVDQRRWETADYQVPIDEFITKLETHDLPKEICVVGLDNLLSDNKELRESLVDTMRLEMDYLNSRRPLPTIQFAVDGEFQSVGDSFDVEIDEEFYALEPVFGRQMKQRESGWIVTTFRV
jgi:hypothetical protein